MRKSLVVLMTLATAQGASAQTCDFDWRPHYEELIRLTNSVVGGNSITEPIDDVAIDEDWEETWYLRDTDDGAETEAFNRLVSATDNMDSPETTESGYSFDLELGFAWVPDSEEVLPRKGLTPVSRYISGSDHRTWLSSAPTPTGYSPDQTYDTNHQMPRYGYERFGNTLLDEDVLQVAYGFQPLQNNVLQIEFNKIWGGAIGQIHYDPDGNPATANSVQLVAEPIGDMVQTVARFFSGDFPDCRVPNPTQSGGAHCNLSTDQPPKPFSFTERRAGSPVLTSTLAISTEDSRIQRRSTTVRPFDFCHNGESGDSVGPWQPTPDPVKPLAWRGHFIRVDRLGCFIYEDGMEPETGGFVPRQDVLRTESQAELAYSSLDCTTLVEPRPPGCDVTLGNTHWLVATNFGSFKNGEFTISLYNLTTQSFDPIVCTNGADIDGDFTVNPVVRPEKCLISPADPFAVVVSRSDDSLTVAVAVLKLPVANSDLLLHEGEHETEIWVKCDDDDCTPSNTDFIIFPKAKDLPISVSIGAGGFRTKSVVSHLVVNNTWNTVKGRLDDLFADGGSCPLVTDELPIFSDGFETGDTTAWSDVEP